MFAGGPSDQLIFFPLTCSLCVSFEVELDSHAMALILVPLSFVLLKAIRIGQCALTMFLAVHKVTTVRLAIVQHLSA